MHATPKSTLLVLLLHKARLEAVVQKRMAALEEKHKE